jgi:cytochrome b-561
MSRAAAAPPIRKRNKPDTTSSDPIILQYQSQQAGNNIAAATMQDEIFESTQESPLVPVVPSGEPTSTSFDDEESDWGNRLRRLQATAIIASHVLALIAMTVVLWWINLLGGLVLSWEAGKAKLVFNWHPLLMITAFSFMTVATFSFRWQYYIPNRRLAKVLHGSAWAVAALCAMVALIAVFHSHNDKQSGFIANLYSLHSWIGVFTILLFVFQFLAGFFTFGVNVPFLGIITQSFKAKMLTVHYYVGPLVYLSTATTILLGIQEKEGFVGCAYKVTEAADLFPIQHLSEIPLACRVSHLLGIVVLSMTVSTMFAMHDFGRGSFHRQ